MTHASPDEDLPVAVILPTLNGGEFIGEQLDALFSQRCTVPWHLVVVDGGSTDHTLRVIEVHAAPVPVRIIRLHGAPGINAGLNAGISATRSPFILIAEHDDVVGVGWMQAIYDALQVHHLVGSHMDRFTLNGPRVAGSRQALPEDVRPGVPTVTATGMGLRRSLWNELGGFDETYRYGGNDIEFCFRAHEAGHSAHLVDGAIVRYRLRADPRSALRQMMAYGIAIVRLYSEFGPAYVRRRSRRTVAREVIRLAWWFPRSLVSHGYRLRLASRLGLQLGLVRGSLRHRKVFL